MLSSFKRMRAEVMGISPREGLLDRPALLRQHRICGSIRLLLRLGIRRTLRSRSYPNIFSTIAVPKAEELVATPYRHGSKEAAESFFLNGMSQAHAGALEEQTHVCLPCLHLLRLQAVRAEGTTKKGITSTGWETFLECSDASSGFSGHGNVADAYGAEATG